MRPGKRESPFELARADRRMTFRGEIVAGLICAGFAALWIATALGLPYLGDYAPG